MSQQTASSRRKTLPSTSYFHLNVLPHSQPPTRPVGTSSYWHLLLFCSNCTFSIPAKSKKSPRLPILLLLPALCCITLPALGLPSRKPDGSTVRVWNMLLWPVSVGLVGGENRSVSGISMSSNFDDGWIWHGRSRFERNENTEDGGGGGGGGGGGDFMATGCGTGAGWGGSGGSSIVVGRSSGSGSALSSWSSRRDLGLFPPPPLPIFRRLDSAH